QRRQKRNASWKVHRPPRQEPRPRCANAHTGAGGRTGLGSRSPDAPCINPQYNRENRGCQTLPTAWPCASRSTAKKFALPLDSAPPRAKFLADTGGRVPKDPLHLSKRERQLMEALYRRGEAIAADHHQDLPDRPSRTAVRTFLRILEDKGHLTHRKEGREF